MVTIPFDVSHMRYIPYDLNDMDSFENELEDTIIETLHLESEQSARKQSEFAES